MLKINENILTLRAFDIPEKHRIKIAVILSLLLHVVFILLGNYETLDFLKLNDNNIIIPAVEEDKRLVFEIVESDPNYQIEEPETDAVLASDKNTRANDNIPKYTPSENRPYSEGIAESKEIPVPSVNSKSKEIKQPVKPFKKFDAEKIGFGDVRTQEKNAEEQENINRRNSSKLLPDSRSSSARGIEGFSLSTYAWDFAPYMLEVKRKIERNINPPTLFFMGLIDGRYLIKFVIERSGNVRAITVLESNGSKTLEETSSNSIKFSNPFKPLPDTFPEKELVVTGKFRFYIIR